MKKERIKRLLWERDFLRKMQQNMVENAIGSYKVEYLGVEPIETDTIKKAEIQTRNNVFHAMVKMLTAFMMNFLFDKVIDEVIEIIEELKDQSND